MSFNRQKKLSYGVDQSVLSMDERALIAVRDENAIAIHKTVELSDEQHAESLAAFELLHPWQHCISIQTSYD